MIEKRDGRWCVVHCTGKDKGKSIKCFPTKAAAEKMHAAIMANKSWNGDDNVEVGNEINKFNYIMDFKKLTGHDGDDDLYIAGVASDDTQDLDGEYMDMSSLRKAWTRYLKTPIIRFQHDAKIGAIGRVVEKFTESDGTEHVTNFSQDVPYIVAKISNAPDLESVRMKIREGIYTGLSIGGRAKVVVKGGKRTLFVKDLLEISVVDRASNMGSFFNVLKKACEGTECELNKSKEDINMESQEIVDIVVKTMTEMKAAEDYEQLQKKYDELTAQVTSEPELEPETDVVKALTEQVEALTAEIAEMKTTPVTKGVQDGDVPAEAPKTDVMSMVLKNHYGVE